MLKFIRINGVLLLFVSITLVLAQILNIWIDEAYSLATTSGTFGEAIERSLSYEIQPPLYFALLALWRSLNPSIFFARLFSIGCMGLAIYLAGGLANRYLKGIRPVWIMTALALHPYAIWAAVEIRAYAFCVLLSVLLLRYFYDGYLSEAAAKSTPSVRWARLGYALTAIAALYTHYFLACLLFGQGVLLLMRRRWPQLRSYVVVMLVASACFLPLLSSVVLHLDGGGSYTEQVSLLAGFRTAIARSLIFAFPTVTDWEGLPPVRLLRYGLGLALLLLVLTQWRRIGEAHWNLWGITVATVAAFGLVLDVTQTVDLAYRYGYSLFVVSVLSLLAALSLLRPDEDPGWGKTNQEGKQAQSRQIFLGSWIVLIALLYTTAFTVAYKPLAKDGDWQRITAQLVQLEQPNQPILMFAAESSLPFGHYYQGQNVVVPLPEPVSSVEYNKELFRLSSEAELDKALAEVGDPARFWLVTGPMFIVRPASPTCPIFNFEFNCNILEQFVARYYTVELDQSFYGSRLRRLHRK